MGNTGRTAPRTLLLACTALMMCAGQACETGNPEAEEEMYEPEWTNDGPEWRMLISFDEWEPIDSFQPLDDVGTVNCAAGAALVEDNSLEVNSTYCSFALFDAPIPEALPTTATLRWRHWHLGLWAAEPAIGTIEFYVGKEQWYQVEYDIPGPADFEEIEFPVMKPIDAGTRITIHFRNHGLNSWRFGAVEILDEAL